jgi:hypothetical protein
VRRLKDLLRSYQESSASHTSPASTPLRASVGLHRSMDPDRDPYAEPRLDRSQLAADSLWHRAMNLADRMAVEGHGEGEGQGYGQGEREGEGLAIGGPSGADTCYPRHLSSIRVKALEWGETSGVEAEGPREMEMELARVRQENSVLRKKVGMLEARQLHDKRKEDSRTRQEAEQENKVIAIA